MTRLDNPWCLPASRHQPHSMPGNNKHLVNYSHDSHSIHRHWTNKQKNGSSQKNIDSHIPSILALKLNIPHWTETLLYKYNMIWRSMSLMLTSYLSSHAFNYAFKNTNDNVYSRFAAMGQCNCEAIIITTECEKSGLNRNSLCNWAQGWGIGCWVYLLWVFIVKA